MVTTYFERAYTRQTARRIYHSPKSIVNENPLFYRVVFYGDSHLPVGIRLVASHQLKDGLHERVRY